MRAWTTAGLIFLSAVSVYNGRAGTALGAAPAGPGEAATALSSGSRVSVLNDATAPIAGSPTTAPASTPATAPSGPQGQSVKAEQINVSKDEGTVEIHVNDANLVEVLRMLSLQSQTNILPSKEVHGTVTANLYGVTIREALDAILKANGYAYKEKGNVVYVYTVKEAADMDKSERKTSTEVFHLFYANAANAQVMIKPVLSEAGQVAITQPALVGITSDGTNAGGNAHATEDLMVITDYPENLEKVRKILKEVDRRPAQILVEATILSASLGDDNALGVDFTLLGGVDFSGLTKAGSSTVDALSGTILNNPSAGGVVKDGFNTASTGFTKNVPAGGLRAGVVTNNVAVFLQALEETTNTVVLANPKVMVLNKMKGEVKVAREDAYRGKITTSESGVSQQQVDFLETGTLLIFRPYIADDGYIRLEVHPEDSSPIPSRSADLPPTKLTTETTTNVMVKDGHTVVIGGLFRETTTTSRSQVPFLGSLPLAGPLFRSQADSTQRSEVIILLTPHIIKDDTAYSAASEEELKQIEKLRAGVRRGLMPIGRERLAESCYECAVAEMAKPHPDTHKALWHLNCATNLNPGFREAINLKERITGKSVTSVDNSSIRSFVQRQILAERAAKSVTAAPAAGAPVACPNPLPVGPAAVLSAAQPATKPSSAQASIPATQPIAAAGKPATQPSVAQADDKFEDDNEEAAAEYNEDFGPSLVVPSSKSQVTAATPTTQPGGAEKTAKTTVPGATGTTVTALPEDEK